MSGSHLLKDPSLSPYLNWMHLVKLLLQHLGSVCECGCLCFSILGICFMTGLFLSKLLWLSRDREVSQDLALPMLIPRKDVGSGWEGFPPRTSHERDYENLHINILLSKETYARPGQKTPGACDQHFSSFYEAGLLIYKEGWLS